MRVLDRKLARELWDNKWLLSAIVSIIVVGVTCLVSMGSAYSNLTEAKRRYYRQCRMADFSIDLKKVPLAELESVGELPGVARIRPRIQFFATVDIESAAGATDESSLEPLNGLVLSLPDRREPILNDVVLKRGDYFTDRRQNEVIVNEAFALAHGLAPGDWIRLVLNNRRQELFIVGTAISSEFVYLLGPGTVVPDPEHFGVFYLKTSYAEDVFDFDGAANQLLGQLSPGKRDSAAEVMARAERMLASYGVFSTTALDDQASNKYLSQEIEGLRSMAFFMPCVFLTVAAMVLNVLLTRLAEQQRTVVGTLKALGYSDRQVFAHFLKFGLSVGLTGALVGCGLGYVLAELLTWMYTYFFEFPDLRNRFNPNLHVSAMTISLLCAVLGSLRGTRAVLRLQPAEAMQPKPPKQGKAIFLERFGVLWSRLSSGWRMVLRGVVRNRMRTAAGVFAAAMGASVLVSGFMMVEASNFLIDFQFKWVVKSDVEVTFKDEKNEDALAEARRLPAVDRAEPILNVACTFTNGQYRHKGGITGLASNATLTVPRDRRARPIRLPSAGLAMSRKMAEILHVQRGDTVTVRPVKGLRQEHSVPVAEIVDSYMGTAVYAEIHYLSRLVSEELAVSGLQLATSHDEAQLRELYRELKEMPSLQGVANRADMVQSLENTLVLNMMVFIGCLVLFAGIVLFGSILNASLVSLAERQCEVATLRVLGYGPWQIGSLLFRESMIVTLLGTVLGMPIGYLLTVGMAASYDSELFRFPVILSPGTLVLTLAMAVLFGTLAHLFVQRSIHRMDWLEALKAKE